MNNLHTMYEVSGHKRSSINERIFISLLKVTVTVRLINSSHQLDVNILH